MFWHHTLLMWRSGACMAQSNQLSDVQNKGVKLIKSICRLVVFSRKWPQNMTVRGTVKLAYKDHLRDQQHVALIVIGYIFQINDSASKAYTLYIQVQ